MKRDDALFDCLFIDERKKPTFGKANRDIPADPIRYALGFLGSNGALKYSLSMASRISSLGR